jgi:biotin carboxylase
MRVCVLGAGGPAGVNWCRALKKAGHEVIADDLEEAHLIWTDPYAVRGSAVRGLSRRGDVMHAVPDPLVEKLAALTEWDMRTGEVTVALVPSLKVVLRCQHKLNTIQTLEQAGCRSGAIPIQDPLPDYLHQAKDKFGLPFWLRATRGAGARGATLVDDLRTGFHWIRYWQTRNTDWEWIAEEYLPGRDYAWTGIYKDGKLVTSFARERLEYIYPNLAPSGLTGTPTRARVVHDNLVNARAEQAVNAVDPCPSGIYGVDLRESAHHTPVVTEINAGRGGTTTGLWSIWMGGPNLADIHARLAVGERVDVQKRDAFPEGLELRRHIDCGHAFVL